MNARQNNNSKLLNKAEIARRTGFSREYIRLLLKGDRTNKEALSKINLVIKQLKAA